MRLIDADALIFEIWETTIQPEWCKALTDKVIRNQPTVDAVPVIRCKDCKWYYRGGATCMFWDGANSMGADDYCSYAERRKDDRRQNNTV